MEGVFTADNCYVQDIAQDSQALSLKIASASHSALEDRLKAIGTEITSFIKFLEENTQHVVEAHNSLFETERRMRILVLKLVKLRKSRDQLEGEVDLASTHLKDKEQFLENLSLEDRKVEMSLHQAKEDLNLLSSDLALYEERKLNHLKSQSENFSF